MNGGPVPLEAEGAFGVPESSGEGLGGTAGSRKGSKVYAALSSTYKSFRKSLNDLGTDSLFKRSFSKRRLFLWG